MMNSNMSY